MLLASNVSFKLGCRLRPKIFGVSGHCGRQLGVVHFTHPLGFFLGDGTDFGGAGPDWLAMFIVTEYACRHG
jgi:hypothetical protein